ncbi:MAG: proline iminopeptidase [Actinomycetota bacterium]|jgi:pimeloyl-ACP methyl ester carboxylesterase|nr:proline iminopeptidase [Actinomycetota bacterium]
MPTLELAGGRRATYETIGRGEPLMMLAGGPGLAAAYLRTAAELLGDRFECYLVDPHGSGGSSPPPNVAAYDHIGHARFYDEVRAALALERITVFGHSFGGTVALTYAALYPSPSERCICMDGLVASPELEGSDAAAAEAEMRRGLARHSGAPWYQEALRAWENWTDLVMAADSAHEVDELFGVVAPLYFAHPDRPEVRDRLERWKKEVRFDLAAVQAWEGGLWQSIDLRPMLSKIQCPLLVIAGEEDLICGPAQAKTIADGARAATLVTIPDCGHDPELEAPDELKRAVGEWLDSADSR